MLDPALVMRVEQRASGESVHDVRHLLALYRGFESLPPEAWIAEKLQIIRDRLGRFAVSGNVRHLKG